MTRIRGPVMHAAIVVSVMACGPAQLPPGTGTASDADGSEGAVDSEAGASDSSVDAGDADQGSADDTGDGDASGSGSDDAGDGDGDASGSGTGGPNPTTTGGADPQTLCESTGGQWDEFSCGHYTCGVPSPDACIDPGCNCGPLAGFVEGVGCVEDPECIGASCTTASECGGGELCTDGCCSFFPGWCPDPVAEIPWSGSCSVSVETGGVSQLVVPACGVGTEGTGQPCTANTDGVEWTPSATGPWLLTLCGEYCEQWAETGSIELYMFCGE